MLEVFSRIDWSALLKSKAVWSGVATAILGIAKITGKAVDPDQVNDALNGLQVAIDGLIPVLGLLTVLFRTQATTQIIKPSADAPAQQLTPPPSKKGPIP